MTSSASRSFRPGPAVAWLWAPVVAYMALIFFVSSLSQPPTPPVVTFTQAHTLGYLGLAVVVARALSGGLPPRLRWTTAVATIAICAAYAVTDECHQFFVPGRSFETGDLVADTVGASIGTVLSWAWGIIAPPSSSRGSL